MPPQACGLQAEGEEALLPPTEAGAPHTIERWLQGVHQPNSVSGDGSICARTGICYPSKRNHIDSEQEPDFLLSQRGEVGALPGGIGPLRAVYSPQPESMLGMSGSAEG